MASVTSWDGADDSSFSISIIIGWLRFLLLSPCPQRALLSSINLLFLLLVAVSAIKSKLFSSDGHPDSNATKHPLLQSSKVPPKTNLWYYLSLIASIFVAIASLASCIMALEGSTQGPWKAVDALFWLLQAVSCSVATVLIIYQKKSAAVKHSLSLRIYWIVNFIVQVFIFTSAVKRLASFPRTAPALVFEDEVSMFVFVLSVVLLSIGIKGTTGVVLTDPDSVINASEAVDDTTPVSGFATASFVSQIFYLWMNPLLKKGYMSPLKIDDVPIVSPQHRADKICDLFEQKWPKPEEKSKHPVGTTLLRCFWKDVAFAALLAIVRLCVMYVGPTLVQNFVDYTARKRNSVYEGYNLVIILLVAKFVEVSSSHQFNFSCKILGMKIRAALVTNLYKKGLRLSSSARQAHGVGQIVNYMAVDVQQLSDMMIPLHSIWLTPLQVGAALAILSGYLGLSTLVALVGILAVTLFVVFGTRSYNKFQFHIMKNRDLRMKAMNEMLNHMRVIKFQAWEEHFSKRILSFRGSEYGWLSKFLYTISGVLIVLWSSSLFITVLTFGCAILLQFKLDAGTVFTVVSLLKILEDPIWMFPESIAAVSQAMVSLDRLDKYMTSRDLADDSTDRTDDCQSETLAVEIKDGSFNWDDESSVPVLKNLKFKIRKGELTAIVGTVGSGKSSILASVLGEMTKLSGKVTVCGSTAYVAQTSWIQNDTIQGNILFGLPMKKEWYNEVIRVCCLEKDLEMLEFGDQTEIGERGINLSGGQKQRIQLARAIYQDCDIYLLDDVFSAVDAHTGTNIFKECIRRTLRDKTILLVTHQVDFLHNVDQILVMHDGMIVETGKYNDLLVPGMHFETLVAAHDSSMVLVEAESAKTREASAELPKASQASSDLQQGKNHEHENSEKSGSSKLIKEEEREIGTVNLRVYKLYCTESFGWWGVIVVLLVALLWQGSQMASDYWLAYETSEKRTMSFSPSLFIEIYAILAVVSFVIMTAMVLLITVMGLKTSQNFFNQFLHGILHAPMSFFDTTPSGRILTRASTDQNNIDVSIPSYMHFVIGNYFKLLGIIIITCQNAWPNVFLMVPLGWMNVWFRGYYLATSRELTRLDSITKAPIVLHFSESLSGIMTIRSFRKQETFSLENIKRVNSNLRMYFHKFGAYEWFGFRLELIGSFMLCISAMFMIVLPSSIIKPEYVGLSLSYGLSLNTILFYAVYASCYLENKMVSVERVKQFTNIAPEAEWKSKHFPPPSAWPHQGNIELNNLQVKYRPNTPLVIKGISLRIEGGEKIGVVGRTGGGKSTLIQVIFRLVEPYKGNIIVDGIDICRLGLHDLRSRFGIIPQEPVLFEGTVRSNVDPIGKYSDDEIWKSLERCQLKDVVSAKPEKLDSLVVDNGENWSVGQRQLLCLGRVMLKRSRILFMDEATASVDSQTDGVIQRIIREDFSSCTIISIAHRIPTVMDCDRVLVIDAGLAKEYDKPSCLLDRPSLFGALVQEYADRSSGI